MSFVQNNWLLIMVAVVSGGMLVAPVIARLFVPSKDIGTLDATRLINSSNAVLVDLRETKDYEGGRLPNALHIPLSQLEGRGAELARHTGRPVIAYSMAGDAGNTAYKALSRLGFTDIHTLKGGFRAWKEAGLPVEK